MQRKILFHVDSRRVIKITKSKMNATGALHTSYCVLVTSSGVDPTKCFEIGESRLDWPICGCDRNSRAKPDPLLQSSLASKIHDDIWRADLKSITPADQERLGLLLNPLCSESPESPPKGQLLRCLKPMDW